MSFLGACQDGGSSVNGEDPRPIADVDLIEIGAPSLVIGTPTDGVEFDRIQNVRRAGDGSIVVADGGASEIRVFGETGEVEARFGGSGAGPGEFEYLQSIIVSSGDTIVAYDSRSHRISVFSLSGDLVRDNLLSGTGSIGDELVGKTGSVYLLAQRNMGSPTVDGIIRGNVSFVRYDEVSGGADTIASSPSNEIFARMDIESGAWIEYQIPFGRDAFHAGGATNWVEGTNDRFDLRVRDYNGNVLQGIRVDSLSKPISNGEVERHRRATLERLPASASAERRATVNGLFQDVARPSSFPGFSRVVVAANDEIWVGEWVSAVSGPLDPWRVWYVVGRDGAMRGIVRLQATVEVHDAGDSWILGVETDPLGVERVVTFEVER